MKPYLNHSFHMPSRFIGLCNLEHSASTILGFGHKMVPSELKTPPTLWYYGGIIETRTGHYVLILSINGPKKGYNVTEANNSESDN